MADKGTNRWQGPVGGSSRLQILVVRLDVIASTLLEVDLIIHSQGSARRCEVGDDLISVNRYLHNFEFDYDPFASALKRGLSSPNKKPCELLGAQEGDIQCLMEALHCAW